MINQATYRLHNSPTVVKSMSFLLGLDSNRSNKRQTLGTECTVMCQPPIQLVPWLFAGVKRPERVKLSTHCRLVTRFKMNGVTPLLPLYVLMALTGTNLPFYLSPLGVYLNIVCLISCSSPYSCMFHLQNYSILFNL
jgi:hypothetical protein